MSKAILVLDEYPSICRECPLCNTSNDDDYCCDIIGDVDGEYDGIDQRCPLKPIPTKMSATANANLDLICNMSREENVIYNVGYTQGRNTCIDEILEEEE